MYVIYACAALVLLILGYLFWKSTLPYIVVLTPREKPLQVSFSFGPLPNKWKLPDLKSVLIDVSSANGTGLTVQITSDTDTRNITYFEGEVKAFYESTRHVHPFGYIGHDATDSEKTDFKRVYSLITAIFLDNNVSANVEYAYSNGFDIREATKDAVKAWQRLIEMPAANSTS
jgi:hypothetical protein